MEPRPAPTFARGALLVAGLELRRRLRDRSAIVVGFVAPFTLAAIISLAFGAGESFTIELGLVDADGSPLTGQIVDGLADGLEGSPLEARRLTDRADARAAVDRGDLDAAIVLPAGFATAVGGARPLPLEVIRDADRRIAGDVATAIAGGVASQVDVGRLSVTAVLASGVAVDDLGALVARAAATEAAVVATDDLSQGGGDLTGYFGPSMAILFLFFTVSMGARSVISERRAGTLRRVLASPIHPGAVLAGKTTATFVVGLAAMLSLWGAMAALFGSDWGDPVGVVALCTATVVAVAGISSLVTAAGRTDSQADALTSIVAFGFALLGGNFLVPSVMPDLLRLLALGTPNGWALQGFTELSVDRAGVAGLATELAVLAGIGLVTGVVALGTLSRRLRA